MASRYQWSYRLSPSGPTETVLFLHGFMGDKDDWTEITDRLRPEYRTLAVDLPGHGESGQVDDEHAYRIESCAHGLIDLLDDLEIGPCHLVGYSMGGRLGLYLILRYPERFLDAVLESTSPGLETEDERAARRAHDEALAQGLETVGLKTFVATWYQQPLFHHLPAGPRLETMLKNRASNAPGGLARSLRFMGTGAQPSLWERLDKAKRPQLFVAGLQDEKFSHIAARMEEACPCGKAVIVENAGHIVHFEQPEMYTELLRLFFAQNRENTNDNHTMA
jgi:2-succinyl-6-hydroxy-2,4-cyclohexadiene-1-carboxylate synthase